MTGPQSQTLVHAYAAGGAELQLIGTIQSIQTDVLLTAVASDLDLARPMHIQRPVLWLPDEQETVRTGEGL